MNFLPPIPEWLQAFVTDSVQARQIYYGSLAAVGSLVLLVVYWRFGRGPRRRRALKLVRRHLQNQAWREAIAEIDRLQKRTRLSPAWQRRLRELHGRALLLAGQSCLEEKRFQESAEHFQEAARLLGSDASVLVGLVVDGMLAEARQLFANNKQAELFPLLERIFHLAPACPEACFWQALAFVRGGQSDQAVAILQELVARIGSENEKPIDPYLYLGTLLLRKGRIQEALRYLSEAKRLCPDSPFVCGQLGAAIVRAGGEKLAIRALQRAIGPSGFPRWLKNPQQAWLEGLAAGDLEQTDGVVCYVRRLALKHPFRCPVFGDDVNVMMREARFALAEAHYRLHNYEEAAELYQLVFRDSPPTLPLLRGLGMTLAKLGRFDEAFRHLRLAFEQEQPKNSQTAAYLALCGALGTPKTEEDKIDNLRWAFSLMGQYCRGGDADIADVFHRLVTEARQHGYRVEPAPLLVACQAMASAELADENAAFAYASLAEQSPDSVDDRMAWLFCHAQKSGFEDAISTRTTLRLFARTCRNGSAAQKFFEQRQWNFADVRYACLKTLASLPESERLELASELDGSALQEDRESLLIRRCAEKEKQGDLVEAVDALNVLLALAPDHLEAWKNAARLNYKLERFEKAAHCFASWHARCPDDVVPFVRLAVVQQVGRCGDFIETLNQSLARASSGQRAAIAYVGSRLALNEFFRQDASRDQHARNRLWFQALSWLRTCLAADPKHHDALLLLAAMLAHSGDRSRLAALAPSLAAVSEKDPLLALFLAVARLAAGDTEAATRSALACLGEERRASLADGERQELCNEKLSWPAEVSFLVGLAQWSNPNAAIPPLRQAAEEDSVSSQRARALLGWLYLQQGDFQSAAREWRTVDTSKRKAWHLDHALPDVVLINGLLALQNERYEEAVDFFREAVKLHCSDHSLPDLLNLARIRAAQALLFEDEDLRLIPIEEDVSVFDPYVHNARAASLLLKQAIQAGLNDPNIHYLLALAYERQKQYSDAKEVLKRISPPDAYVLLLLGSLTFREKKTGSVSPYQLAEQYWKQAWSELQTEPTKDDKRLHFAVGYNLLRLLLSLGKLEEAFQLLPAVLELATSRNKGMLTLLGLLLQCSLAREVDDLRLGELMTLSASEETALLEWITSLGCLETSEALLLTLAAARSESARAGGRLLEAKVLRAKALLDRGKPLDAEHQLTVLEFRHELPAPMRAALLNLLGCCSVLAQDFVEGSRHFHAALQIAPDDPRIVQNLALAWEFQGYFHRSLQMWNQFFELVDDSLAAPSGFPNYREALLFESLRRLGARLYEQERWEAALQYLQRAYQLQPEHPEVLERLFHTLNQLHRVDQARTTLARLRQLRADSPQLDIYELELYELHRLEDIEPFLSLLERIVRHHPGDRDVLQRSHVRFAHLLNFLIHLNDQYRDILHQTARDVNRLPSRQINWEQLDEFVKQTTEQLSTLKQSLLRCAKLADTEPQRRQIKHLLEAIEQEISLCHTLAS